MKDIIGRFGKDLERHLIEKGSQKREKEIIEIINKTSCASPEVKRYRNWVIKQIKEIK